MKRSDLVEDIYNYIDGYTHDILREKHIRGLAEFIVEEVEKIMLPPAYYSEKYGQTPVHEWEPEDD